MRVLVHENSKCNADRRGIPLYKTCAILSQMARNIMHEADHRGIV